MQTILITGGNGFIGKNCASYLQHEYRILCPSSKELDLRNESVVQSYFHHNTIDYIIHCATVGGVRGQEDSLQTIVENCAMVEHLLRYKKQNTYMITFGSGAMYGRHRNLHKISEDEIGRELPHDRYGLSKVRIAEMLCNRDDVLLLIIFACYGYGEKESRFPTYALLQTIQNKSIDIEQDVVFDYLFVEDMQNIVATCLRKPPSYTIMNITPTESITLTQIATIAQRIHKVSSSITVKKAGFKNEYTGDNSRLREILPSFHFTDYRTGITKLYHHLIQTK